MEIRATSSLSFSPEFIRKTGGGCTERLLEFLDRVFSVSSQNITFHDVSENRLLITETVIPVSKLELVAKLVIGILLLPLTILAIALKIILRCVFYTKTHAYETIVVSPKDTIKDESPAEDELTPSTLLTPAVKTKSGFSPEEVDFLKEKLTGDLSTEEILAIKSIYSEVCKLRVQKQEVLAKPKEEREKEVQEIEQLLEKLSEIQETLLNERDQASRQLNDNLQLYSPYSPEITNIEMQCVDLQNRINQITETIQKLESDKLLLLDENLSCVEIENKFDVEFISNRELKKGGELIFSMKDHPTLSGKRICIREVRCIPKDDLGFLILSAYERGKQLYKEKVSVYESMFKFWEGTEEDKSKLLSEDNILQTGGWYYQPVPFALGEKILAIVESASAFSLLSTQYIHRS